MKKINVKKGDKVIVLSGKDVGKTGEVIAVLPKESKVIVEGVNVCYRHTKARKQGDESGIIKKACPIYACKVMRVCPKCGKPTKAASKIVDGKKTRVCKKCGAEI
ncbi:MAG: 50S ribosomal protein L24 [Clostridiales bacterium]|nr:50S ribosomal protein L24 [Clostridiales bacterium]MCD7754576.1 50S ribosomal protein L24 [Clostridiales bacterium]MCD7803311.1 50S ribosomal protein L24 [Clostridiales bacterium]MCD7881837.1 50S ribosomal protein L24 [Clostridiales bacterium]MCD8047162.1 50S ribosomal protein L24 [Clostridiales bacterium]